MQTTLDGLLNRRVSLDQPAQGFRVAVDTVLLAAAVPAYAGDAVLDLGCGVGGAMLCLSARVQGIHATGVEIQMDLADFCARNIARNGFQASMNILMADVTQLPRNLAASFDHVMMNPPYHAEAEHDVSPNAVKRTANTEKDGDLPLWISAAAKGLRKDGMLTLIHRADRLDEILALAADAGFGEARVLHVFARHGEIEGRRGRVIVRARKNFDGDVRICRPLILHKDSELGGGYTDDADAILRHMKPVNFIEK